MPPRKRSEPPRNGTHSTKSPKSSDWIVEISDKALAEIDEISIADKRRIFKFLNERLPRWPDPRKLGEVLAGSLAGLWRFRVGDYRVVYQIDDARHAIRIVRIGHRREIYR